MANQIILVLVLQTIFFSFYYKFGFKVASIIGRRICPVCFAVGSTWLTLLVLRYSGIYLINPYLIALLLAESVVGVSYLTEEFFMVHPEYKFPEHFLKFGIIIYGTLAVTLIAFFNEIVGIVFFLPVIVFGFLALTPTKKLKDNNNPESSLLMTKLKNCC